MACWRNVLQDMIDFQGHDERLKEIKEAVTLLLDIFLGRLEQQLNALAAPVA